MDDLKNMDELKKALHKDAETVSFGEGAKRNVLRNAEALMRGKRNEDGKAAFVRPARRPLWKILAACAAAFILIIGAVFGGLFVNANYTAAYKAQIDINISPSIQLEVNLRDIVRKAEALDETAESLNPNAFKNSSLDDFFMDYLKECKDAGLINETDTVYITVAVEEKKNGVDGEEKLELIIAAIEKACEELNIKVEINGPGPQTPEIPTVNKYTYTFYDDDGTTVLKILTADSGTVIIAPGNPAKAATAQYTYTFGGWNPAFSAGTVLTADISYTAAYAQTVNKYTITWIDGDGNAIGADEVEYGQTPTYTGATPTKTATAEYTYTFNGTWSPAVVAVTGAATYTAQFSQTANEYTVIFKDWNGAVLDTQTVEHGLGAAAPANPNSKTGWHFVGWDADFSNVTFDLTVTAVYEEDDVIPETYTIKFISDGETVLEITRHQGENIYVTEAPVPPPKEGQTFAGWYRDAAMTQPVVWPYKVTADAVLNAKWVPDGEHEEKYTVIFFIPSATGGFVQYGEPQKVLPGETITAPAIPPALIGEGKALAFWSLDKNAESGDETMNFFAHTYDLADIINDDGEIYLYAIYKTE